MRKALTPDRLAPAGFVARPALRKEARRSGVWHPGESPSGIMETVSSKAVCLLSGGLDSSTCLGVAKRQGFECYALSFDYGQRHRIELESAARVARHFQVCEQRVLKIDLRTFGASALTADIAVPKTGEIGDGIPVTYVPARNTIFLSF